MRRWEKLGAVTFLASNFAGIASLIRDHGIDPIGRWVLLFGMLGGAAAFIFGDR